MDINNLLPIIVAINAEATYRDGQVIFPAYLYEQLKQALGIDFRPEYLEVD